MSSRRHVKLKQQRLVNTTGRGRSEYVLYSLHVPTEIGVLVPEGTKFTVELTEDGILFRPVLDKVVLPDPPPRWVTAPRPQQRPEVPETTTGGAV